MIKDRELIKEESKMCQRCDSTKNLKSYDVDCGDKGQFTDIYCSQVCADEIAFQIRKLEECE